MTERGVQYPSFGESVKKVFYGVGKAVESQSPRAWNERIIRTINEKIIPKLTPDQLKFVAKHQKVIETTAKVWGFTISTVEHITFFALAGLAEHKVRLRFARNRFEKTLSKNFHENSFFRSVRDRFFTQNPDASPDAFTGMGLGLIMLISRLRSEKKKNDPSRKNIFLKPTYKKEARNVLQDMFRISYEEGARLRDTLYGRHPLAPEAYRVDADRAFDAWDDIGFAGAEAIARLAGADSGRAHSAFEKLEQVAIGGRRMVVEGFVDVKSGRRYRIQGDSFVHMTDDDIVEVEPNQTVAANIIPLDKVSLRRFHPDKPYANNTNGKKNVFSKRRPRGEGRSTQF